MDNDIVRLLREQEKILGEMRSNVHRWMDELLRNAFDPESFLRYIASLGIDLSQVPKLLGQRDDLDPYRVLGLEKTATDEEIKTRYRILLRVFHPDTAAFEGSDHFFQEVTEAYQQIAKERGWH